MLSFNNIDIKYEMTLTQKIDLCIYTKNKSDFLDIYDEIAKLLSSHDIAIKVKYKSSEPDPYIIITSSPVVIYDILSESLKNTSKDDIEFYKKYEEKVTKFKEEFREELNNGLEKLFTTLNDE